MDKEDVTQADREAAGPYANCLSDMQDIFEGKADGLQAVQAFAAHRIQSREAVIRECAAVAKTHFDIAASAQKKVGQTDYNRGAKNCASIIEAGILEMIEQGDR